MNKWLTNISRVICPDISPKSGTGIVMKNKGTFQRCYSKSIKTNNYSYGIEENNYENIVQESCNVLGHSRSYSNYIQIHLPPLGTVWSYLAQTRRYNTDSKICRSVQAIKERKKDFLECLAQSHPCRYITKMTNPGVITASHASLRHFLCMPS